MTDIDNRREHIATCGCGQLTLTVRGEPADVYLCSCLACQRKSGSAFTYGAIYPAAAVSATGECKTWRHRAESGRWIESQFCPTCGVTVYFRSESMAGMVGVNAGCFADRDFAKPERLYWASRRHDWLTMPDDVEMVSTQPG